MRQRRCTSSASCLQRERTAQVEVDAVVAGLLYDVEQWRQLVGVGSNDLRHKVQALAVLRRDVPQVLVPNFTAVAAQKRGEVCVDATGNPVVDAAVEVVGIALQRCKIELHFSCFLVCFWQLLVTGEYYNVKNVEMFYTAQYLETKYYMWCWAFGAVKNRIFFLPV